MRPLLSICIPTFRRAEIIYKTVQDHLSITNEKIEVVVCDNHSPDHTLELLSTIKDSRFKLYTNDKNMGFPYNLCRVIKEATGYFVCMMSDEDTLNKHEITLLLTWIESFIENNMGISVVISGSNSNLNIITKEDELINALYGRTSYMSGLIINRDKLEDNDFIISNENYYPHIQLILRAGVKGRIIYTNRSLYEQTYHDNTSIAESIEIQKDSELAYKETYLEPNSRLKQLKTERNMILELNINKELKWKLFTKQYYAKYLQGTLIYELVTRNEKLFKSGSNGHKVSTLGMNEKFNEVYIRGVKKYIGEEYLDLTIDEATAATNYIRKVQCIRNDFDMLVNEKKYPAILVGDIPFIQGNVDDLLDYGFYISYVCTNDVAEEELGNRWLRMEDLKKFSKMVLIVDKNNTAYIETLNNLEIEEAHLFNISDFRISL